MLDTLASKCNWASSGKFVSKGNVVLWTQSHGDNAVCLSF